MIDGVSIMEGFYIFKLGSAQKALIHGSIYPVCMYPTHNFTVGEDTKSLSCTRVSAGLIISLRK